MLTTVIANCGIFAPKRLIEIMPENQPLAGRCVLVTGGARRVGAAIVRAMHDAGANVAIHFHQSGDDARALASELEAARARSTIAIAADIRELGSLAGLVDAVVQRFERLDVLVNNASSFYPTPVGTISLSQWDDLIDTNLRAPVFLSQAAAAELRKAQGCIINLADIHGQRPLKQHTVYSTAKAGLIMLTRSLAKEMGPEIRVNAIAPGPVLWPDDDLSAELKNEIVAKTALKRTGSPQDIARTALFLTAYAPYVTGQVIAVDGGRSI
jgi:pteridine reductase